MKKQALAIIIPAYKATYLEHCLDSIAAQTDQRFHLYIGDDGSPEPLAELLQKYKFFDHFHYHRFDQNLGGKDLVAHWQRCLEMTQGEEWIWLFSDDDVMDANCVEKFYQQKDEVRNKDFDLFHFNLQVIDQEGRALWPIKPFPPVLSAQGFVDRRFRHQLHSSVVEYIFRRTAFEAVGGFEAMDLAWFSDDATWVKLMGHKGVATLSGALVYWRFSEQNISSTSADLSILSRKVDASLVYWQWIKSYFAKNGLELQSSEVQQIQFLLAAPLNSKQLGFAAKWKYVNYILDAAHANSMLRTRIKGYFLWFYAKQTLGLWLGRGPKNHQQALVTSITPSSGNS